MTAALFQSVLVLRSGPCDYDFNMGLDEALLEASVTFGAPVLRFYSWRQPAASFGYFQKFADVEKWTRLRPLVRRPTGGGLVPHDADWTYSLAVPPLCGWYHLRAIESYFQMHEWLRLAFSQVQVASELAPTSLRSGPGQCFVGYEQNDLLSQGRKIAGAAQRRTRLGLLIQGSVQPPPGYLDRAAWEAAVCATTPSQLPGSWAPLELSQPMQEKAARLAREKYSQPAYTQRR